MKRINSFNDALEYVNRLGFGKTQRDPGWIVYAQQKLVEATDMLLKASGNESWYEKTFVPFDARLERYVSESGFYFPFLSTFYVRRFDGTLWRLKQDRYYPYQTLEQIE